MGIQPSKKRWNPLFFGGLILCFLLCGGFLLMQKNLSGQAGGPNTPSLAVQLREKSPFHIEKTDQIMGIGYTRVNRQNSGQRFVLLSGVNDTMCDYFFNDKLDMGLVETFGNTYLKLKNRSEKTSMKVDKLKTLENGSMKIEGKTVPYKKIELTVKISTESAPRIYKGVVARWDDTPTPTLLISYDREADYNEQLASAFLENVEPDESP